MSQKERPFQVCRKNRVPAFLGRIEQVLATNRSDPRIVDQQIKPAKASERLLHQPRAIGRRTDVGLNRNGGSARLLDFPNNLFGCRRLEW